MKKIYYALLVLALICVIGIIFYSRNPIIEYPMEKLKITSPAFEEGEQIPAKYTCDGDNINPPLEIE